ncbi:unnamed protein product [Arabis nemorensis]|uniref:Cystatin domain-containing protein n=1 Tax=Arabis nemorensis TaxID=586526 RepID=A0A565BWZ6_9BRAS|nr:unnamed protein product [Arabis nemorensis]
MDSKVVERDSKRQKLEEDEKLEEHQKMEDDEKSEEHEKVEEDEKLEEVSSPSTEEWDDEDVRLFEEEHKRSGDYDFDDSKVGGLVGFHRVVFEDREFATEPETDGDLVERLSKIALKKHNDDKNTNLELVRAVKANWNHGGGYIFSITLEAKDASSSHTEPIPFHAKVGYLHGDTKVYHINPKP